jgi:transposase-like protein
MNNPAKQAERRRRSPSEVATVVAAFEQSGLSRTEYCRQHGLSLSTLNRHRQGTSEGSGITPGLVSQALPALSLIPVDVVDGRHKSPRMALYIELAGARRIGVDPGFDAETLRRLIAVLEAA